MPITLALKLLSYPAWQAQVDGREVHFEVQPVTARLLLPLPAGTHRVEIRFRRTWDRTAGDAISAISCIALLGFAVRKPRGGAAASCGANFRVQSSGLWVNFFLPLL